MRMIFAVAAASLFASAALAQMAEDPAAQQKPNNAAVKSMHQNNAAAPVAGANSFTRGQAKSAIEAKGYRNVSHLVKDKDGVWRGTAEKDGQSVPVSLDYQGNVN